MSGHKEFKSGSEVRRLMSTNPNEVYTRYFSMQKRVRELEDCYKKQSELVAELKAELSIMDENLLKRTQECGELELALKKIADPKPIALHNINGQTLEQFECSKDIAKAALKGIK